MSANRYPGNCHSCGARLEAGQGTTVRVGEKWAVQHVGRCPTTDPGRPAQPAAATVTLTPTPEQAECIRLFATGEDLVIQAGAGSGKTSVLLMLAQQAGEHDREGQYLAYNKAIVADVAKKVPGNISACTMHSLAYRALGYRYKARLNVPRQKQEEVARILGLDPWSYPFSPDGVRTESRRLAPGFLAGLVLGAVRRFCSTADPDFSAGHFRLVEGLDMPRPDGTKTYANNDELRRYLLPYARKAWEDINDVDGWLRYSHDYYLKIWERSSPCINTDFILLDEAQDADKVQVSIVKAQRKFDTQIVVVGDSCQPAGTLVSVASEPSRNSRWAHRPATVEQVPIEQVQVGDMVVAYNVAHRYLHRNGCRVTGISSRPYAGRLVKVATADGLMSRYTPDHHCVVRFGDGITDKHLVYLMRKGNHFRVGITGGRLISQGKRLGLTMRALAENADAMWILGVFPNKATAIELEATLAWTYGVPDVMFRALGHGAGQEGLNRFWVLLGNNHERARTLLRDSGLDPNYPLWEKGHSLQTRRPFVTRACNLVAGMEVLPVSAAMMADGHCVTKKSWVPVTVSREEYEGTVWSIDVAQDHTYVADGIITHNCQAIYTWRGAVDALADFELEGANTATLSQSFRFGDPIAEVANNLLGRLRVPLRLRGFGPVISTVGPIAEPSCILTRTNAGAIEICLSRLDAGYRPFLVGGGKEVTGFCTGALALQRGQRTSYPELACFESWAEVQLYVVTDENGQDLALMVKLVDDYGAQVILDALAGQGREEDADVVVSTAHKSKGRQWSRVQIHEDFFEVREGDRDLPASELRLCYVAATRAQHELDLSAVPQFLRPPARVAFDLPPETEMAVRALGIATA